MADYPVIFSAPMVLALLAGRKTQTRRLAWRWPRSFGDSRPIVGTAKTHGDPTPWQRVKPGDRLWVRENLGFEYRMMRPTYAAGPGVLVVPNAPPEFCGPTHRYASRPCIHMPRWASRFTLVITATRIESLQAISAADAMAEGIERRADRDFQIGHDIRATDPVGCFSALWWSLHGIGTWDENPEVVALTFAVHQRNIDEMKEAA